MVISSVNPFTGEIAKYVTHKYVKECYCNALKLTAQSSLETFTKSLEEIEGIRSIFDTYEKGRFGHIPIFPEENILYLAKKLYEYSLTIELFRAVEKHSLPEMLYSLRQCHVEKMDERYLDVQNVTFLQHIVLKSTPEILQNLMSQIDFTKEQIATSIYSLIVTKEDKFFSQKMIILLKGKDIDAFSKLQLTKKARKVYLFVLTDTLLLAQSNGFSALPYKINSALAAKETYDQYYKSHFLLIHTSFNEAVRNVILDYIGEPEELYQEYRFDRLISCCQHLLK